jgi:hypothetical protein
MAPRRADAQKSRHLAQAFTVAEVAHQVGYGSGSTLSVAFTRHVGLGGYAARRASNRAGSAFDLFVIGSVTFGEVVDALSAAQTQLARELNPSVFEPGEYQRRVRRRDHFVLAVSKEEKVFVVGGQHELDGLGGRRVARRA